MDVIGSYGTILLVLACGFGLFMAWGIGANDVANAMGTSVGARALTLKQAILVAAVFEFAGAYLAGGEVTSTIRKGIVDPGLMTDTPELLVYGMLSALLAAGTWLAHSQLERLASIYHPLNSGRDRRFCGRRHLGRCRRLGPSRHDCCELGGVAFARWQYCLRLVCIREITDSGSGGPLRACPPICPCLYVACRLHDCDGHLDQRAQACRAQRRFGVWFKLCQCFGALSRHRRLSRADWRRALEPGPR